MVKEAGIELRRRAVQMGHPSKSLQGAYQKLMMEITQLRAYRAYI
jgi:hypothetical protein